MSKHTDKYPEFDGSGDWKTWTGKIRPKLFKKKSQAYPDKTLFHLTKLEQTPRERGPLVKHVLKAECCCLFVKYREGSASDVEHKRSGG